MRSAIAPAVGGGAALRSVWGYVLSDGSIYNGSGNFVVQKAATGVYRIWFVTPFAELVAISATPIGARVILSDGDYTISYFRLVAQSSLGGAGVDTNFVFHVSGRMPQVP